MPRVKSPLLDGHELIKTVHRLTERIRSSFPSAHLNQVAAQLQQVVERHAARSGTIRRPHWGRRLTSLALLLATVRMKHDGAWQIAEAMQTLDAGLSMLFFLGAGAAYVASLEQRSKRQRCLEALHELRAIAHIVDLHQLGKQPGFPAPTDAPAIVSAPAGTTTESPLTTAQLVAYLEFCSEMLSLLGKVAALYVQGFPDERAVAAVDDIEDLTSGLSRKIWQKIMVLGQTAARA